MIVVIAETSNKLIRIRGFHIDYLGHAQLSAFLSPLSGCVPEGTRRAASFVPATDASNELRSMVAATPSLIFSPLGRTDIRASTSQRTLNGKNKRPQFYV
jgi:hypothetical protein